ncbi:MAG: ParB/RepB/Spo0J family partition protein [Pseudomonadota bacterium]
MIKKRGLGRGLGALIDTGDEEALAPGAPLEIPISTISANPLQPRAEIKSKDLSVLAASIKDKGILEPLVVRRLEPGFYELIAGERRLRAAQLAGLEKVPVTVRQAEGVERLELALIENILRQDLNAIEEAEGYRRLAEEFARTNEDIARLTGKDRSTVANLQRLLSLPGPVQEDVRQGRLTAGHARALLALNNQDRILEAREKVLAGGLSVRETENLVKRILREKPRKSRTPQDEAFFQALSDNFSRALGAKVKVVHKGRKGKIEISYSSNADLERLMKVLGVGGA